MKYVNLLPILDRFAALPVVFYRFLITKNNEWRFVYVSPEILSLYEIHPEEAYADHMIMTSAIHPEDAESHRKSVEACFQDVKPWRHDHRIIPKSGELKWVRAQAVPELLIDGSVQWNGVLTDITDLKFAEEQLLRRHLKKQQESFAQHIHDEIGSRLFGTSMLLSGIKDDSPTLRLKLNSAISEIDISIKKIRDISYEMLLPTHPKQSFSKSLGDFSSELELRAKVKCFTNLVGDVDVLDAAIAYELLMIVREAALNSIKHGHATQIHIEVYSDANGFGLSVGDNGRGFEPDSIQTKGVGLRSMKARALKLHASISINSERSKGTLVSLNYSNVFV
jgi:two-component system sensor histidine kinase UhpB